MSGFKLQRLQRTLAGETNKDDDHRSATLTAEGMLSAIRRDAQRQVTEAQQQRDEALQRVQQLEQEVREAKTETANEVAKAKQEAATSFGDMKARMEQQIEQAKSGSTRELDRLRREIAEGQRALVTEQRQRTVAETELAAVGRDTQRLEKMNEELKNAKLAMHKSAPVPTHSPMKGATAKVTQRDQQGRIVSFEIIPNA